MVSTAEHEAPVKLRCWFESGWELKKSQECSVQFRKTWHESVVCSRGLETGLKKLMPAVLLAILIYPRSPIGRGFTFRPYLCAGSNPAEGTNR